MTRGKGPENNQRIFGQAFRIRAPLRGNVFAKFESYRRPVGGQWQRATRKRAPLALPTSSVAGGHGAKGGFAHPTNDKPIGFLESTA